jgi:AsmA protein
MSSLVKWILGAIAALVALIIIAMLSIPLFIDPNDYKDHITRAVQEQTGRELSIPGDIQLSISPSLQAVFTLGDVNLSSGKDFQDSKFLSSELVDIKLALWPLISSRKLMINSMGLKGVDVNLIRDSSGLTNWSDLAGGGKEKQELDAPPAGTKQPTAKPAKPLPEIDIGGIEIDDINVTYTDRQAGRTIKLTNFSLNAGHIVERKPFSFDAGFSVSVDDGKNPLTATTGLSGKLTFDLVRMLFSLDQLKLKTDIAEAPVPVRLFGLEMSAEANLDTSVVTISDLLIKVDDTTITGTATISDLKKPAYMANLHIDQLNLDRYTTEKKTTAEAAAEPPAENAPSAPAAATPREQVRQGMNEEPSLIPVELLRGLTFTAEIKIDRLEAAKLVTTSILVKVTGKEGLVQLQPFTADLYQGTIAVTGDIDARPDIPEMKLTKELKGVELGPMFMAMKGKEEIKGKADIKAAITTRGLTRKELTRNANGTMNLSLTNGEIAKLKIIDTIRLAKQLYDVGSGGSLAMPSRNKSESGRPTSFADLSASGVITNGVFKNDDLVAQSELMKVTGKGTVDLNTERINYLLTIYLAKTLERDEEKDLVEMADTPIPYKVEGTFDKIEQSAALKEVLKAGAIKLLSRELDKHLGGEESTDGEKKDSSGSTEELINKGLKSLFGK